MIKLVTFVAVLWAMSPALSAGQATPPRGVVVAGSVRDQTGAVLPGAQVTLTTPEAPPRTETTDQAGRFAFDRIPPGAYDLRAEFPGFAVYTTRQRVASRNPAPLTIVLQIEALSQEVSVGGGGNQTSASAAANLDAVSVDASALDNMPVLDDDVIGAVSRFLDSSAIGTNGTTLVVDGVEVNSLSVSSSAVQEIKINQDPYAAEYMRPGRGRIEIVTKPGGQAFSGTMNVRFRDSALYARNAFAATKPHEQRRVVEGSLGGPLGSLEKTNFLISALHDAEDNQSPVFADTLAGTVQTNVATPLANTLLAGTINRQQGEHNTISLRFSHQNRSADNQGVGGITLPEGGRNTHEREDDTTYSQQTIVSERLLHEFRLMVGFENQPFTSINSQPRIVVNDAFIGGGAQGTSLRTEKHFTLMDDIVWSSGRHAVKAGVNVPDWSWRGYVDQTNVGGTFFFSNLRSYAAAQPYAFSIQQGDGRVAFLEKVIGLFVQDEIRLTPALTVNLGLRYDWQDFFHDPNNFAPRISTAYSPGRDGRTVVRTGAGVFYDRTGPGPIQDLLRYDGQHLQQMLVVDPGYPDPFAAATGAAAPSNLVRLAPDVTIPYTVHYSASVERQLARRTTLALTFLGARGYDLFRSRDINAPAPPLFLSRPDPSVGVVREIESAGTMRTASWQATLRGQPTKALSGTVQYTYGRAYNDTSGVTWMPPNSYDLSGEYGPADFDRRHTIEMFGSWAPHTWFTLGASWEAYTGRPYSLTLGTDPFNTGQANARPAGVARNSLRGPGYSSLDLRASRDIVWHGPKPRTITLSLDAFNVFDRVNDSSFVGNLSSPFFGQAVSAYPARRIQFSLRTRF